MPQTHLEKYSELLQHFYRAFHIPVSLYLLDRQMLSYVAVVIQPDPAARFLKNAFSVDRKEAQKPFYTSHHGVNCGMVAIHETDFRIAVGPVSSIPPTPQQCSDILAGAGLPFSCKKKLLYSLKKAPILDTGRFLSLLNFLDFILNGTARQPVDADEISNFDPFEKLDDPLYEVNHNTLAVENSILYAVEHGKTDDLLSLLFQVPTLNLSTGVTAQDPIRIAKNAFIASAALVSRAAVRGGLDYDYALTLTDLYISKMEMLKNEWEIAPLIGKMMLDFCVRVAELNKPSDCSPLTVAILEDVNRHLQEVLTVEDMAGRLGRSPSYLSRTFERDMGITLKQYILQQKVKEAQWLLLSTKAPIAEIAMGLGFSSQPHFQTAFKRIAEVTPSVYRERFSTKDGDGPLYSRLSCP